MRKVRNKHMLGCLICGDGGRSVRISGSSLRGVPRGSLEVAPVDDLGGEGDVVAAVHHGAICLQLPPIGRD